MYTLSFIISTRNRLPFLKITLEKLLTTIQDDEEIVVVDGDSNDGSKEYLQQLFDQNKIDQFISEPDKNQAHGWNKAMLMTNGVLIKKIIDDDVFCYPAIRKCKEHMLQNCNVDVLISNDMSSKIDNTSDISFHSRFKQFINWKNGVVSSFTFGDVHMLIRKNSLAYIGLYRTDFIMMDWEFALRISYLKANIKYYTGYNALSVSHQGTVSNNKSFNEIQKQGKNFLRVYGYRGDNADVSYWSIVKIFVGRLIYNNRTTNIDSVNNSSKELADSYFKMYDFINNFHAEHALKFEIL